MINLDTSYIDTVRQSNGHLLQDWVQWTTIEGKNEPMRVAVSIRLCWIEDELWARGFEVTVKQAEYTLTKRIMHEND